MKDLILSFGLIFLALVVAQGQDYDIRFNRSSVNCQTRTVCYDVQLRPNGPSFNLAGQNYRIYYDGSKASWISGSSLLPSQYQGFTLVPNGNIQNVDASATNGLLSFDATLSFLNYGMDLNDTQNGGINLPTGQWTTTSNLCFTVTQDVVDNPNVCVEAVWAREALTSQYATAYVEVSKWLSSNNTTNAVPNQYIDLNASSGDQACLNIACAPVSLPTISVSNLTANENGGSANVQVCLSAASTTPVTVTLNTSNGTALASSDFVAISNATVTIPAGQLCTPVNIPILDDAVAEGNETFTVTLSNPSANVTLGNATATVTIADNEGVPSLSINSVSVNENDGTAGLTVTLSAPAAQNVTFTINNQNGTAVAPSDFTAISNQTFTIPAGQTSVAINIPVINDLLIEGNESFNVVMSNPSANATILTGTGSVTIIDNDAPIPAVSVSNIAVNENGGSASVQVCLSSASTTAVTLTLNTSNGTATSGSDYVAISNAVVTIPAGQLCTPVNIPILDDNIAEGNETFSVTISNPSSNATLGTSTATVTVVDNESVPSLSINSISVNENDGTASLTVSLSAPAEQNVTFTVNTQNGSAVAPGDYIAITSQTYTILAGQTTVAINIPVVEDVLVEGNETFNVVLSNPSANATILSGTGSVTIIDNEVACSAQAPVISGN